MTLSRAFRGCPRIGYFNFIGVFMRRGTLPSIDSAAVHKFSSSPGSDIPRSKFDRSHGIKTTFYEGELVPIYCDEMLPGDTFNLRLHAFSRISTLLFPIMDNLELETHFFAVPNRILWDNWEKFCGAQDNPGDPTDFTVPQATAPTDGFGFATTYDYMGLPWNITGISVNQLHLRAYNLIWNEWFRDENLQDSVVVDTDDGPDTYTDYTTILPRGKYHDYFTSCLPFPQKGPDVLLPLGVTAPVIGLGKQTQVATATGSSVFETGGPNTYAFSSPINNMSSDNTVQMQMSAATGGLPLVYADLTDATASTINDIRLAFQTQKLYEHDARGGTRYTESIRNHFGVISPDMRLQRPEYIGGGSSPLIVNPVAATAYVSSSHPVGQLAAYGIIAPQGHGFTYSATEHMVIIGLVSVRADLNYFQGMDRMWSRQTRLDYYWPALSHLGEQAVLNQEIYAQGSDVDTEVFGYQERYAEYRYKPSLVTARMRPNVSSDSADGWHLAQSFSTLPVLNDEFIIEDAPMSRITAGETGWDFIFDGFFSLKCARPMPVYAVPGLVDHF